VRRNVSQQKAPPVAVSAAFCAAFAALGIACSEEQYNPPIGGSTTVAAASSAGSGGSSGSAGQSGNAGSSATNSGGSAGAAGGAGGAANDGMAMKVYAFESSLQGFFINYYCTGPAMNTNCMQLDAPAGDTPDAGNAPEQPESNDFFSLEQDPGLGTPEPGSAKLTLRFTAGAQSANFASNFGSATEPGIDLAGKTLQAQVRVEAGAPVTTYAKMYIKTGATYYYADSGQKTLVADSWTPLTFAGFGAPSYPTAPDAALYTPGDVREIGLEIGAIDVASAVTAEVHIDSFSF
jgi:hypothetical protein